MKQGKKSNTLLSIQARYKLYEGKLKGEKRNMTVVDDSSFH